MANREARNSSSLRVGAVTVGNAVERGSDMDSRYVGPSSHDGTKQNVIEITLVMLLESGLVPPETRAGAPAPHQEH